MKKAKINERGVNEKLWGAHIDCLVKKFPKEKVDSVRFVTTGENLVVTKIGGDDTEFILLSKLQGNKIKHYSFRVLR